MTQHATERGRRDGRLSMAATYATSSTQTAHAHRSFRVMGSAANITLVAPDAVAGHLDGLLDQAETRLRALESLWSRFRPASDVTRANLASGSPVTVHPDTIAVVLRAVEAWKQTRGLFDATVLAAAVRLGDTASLAGIHSDAFSVTTAKNLAPPISAAVIGVSGSIEVDRERNTVTVPAGAAIDLGGIGKGFAADLVAFEMILAGVAGVMVQVGGDLAVRGIPASGERWLVGIEDPTDQPRLIASLSLVIGGMSTSATGVRRWRSPGGETVHHLIDPSTSMPSATTLLSATVVAADAATAEAFATAAMMHDAPGAIAFLDSAGLPGLVVTRDVTTLRTRSLRAFAS